MAFDHPESATARGRTMRFFRGAGALLAAVSMVAGCGGGDESAPGGSTAAISVPTTINLTPADQNGAQRLFVSISAVGTQQTSLPLLFDTGSGGLTLDATKIFPASLLGPRGFVFANGATSLSYGGITVTNAGVDAVYSSTIQHGNIGSATITFGDRDESVSTAAMPILFYYSVTDRAGNPQPLPPQKGIFGVGPTTTEANGNLASPMRYLPFTRLDAGFRLDPVGSYPPCDITQGSCLPKPLLTLGLDPAQESGFTLFPLICDLQTIVGPSGSLTVNPGTGGCASLVPGVVSVAGVALTAAPLPALLFDTGTPGYSLSTILTQSAPADDALVQVSVEATDGSAQRTHAWRVGNGVDASTPVSSGPVVIGSNFFLTHAYLVDFSTHRVGIR